MIMMKVGLVDVDGHNFPNLCIMKLSSWHKAQGDDVEFAIPFIDYDKIYMAKVFDNTYTKDDITAYQCKDIVKGGTGYGLDNKLPDEIEHIMPDYSLYGINDTAYGFMTRGCPRGCAFCIVGTKEGRCSKKVADLSEFWSGQKYIKLLDPNIIACQQWKDLLQQLIDSKAKVDFTQGLDIRLMAEEKAEMLNEIKLERIHFAWDNYPDDFCYNQLKKYRSKFKIEGKRLGVYVLTNFNTTIEQDLDRLYRLRDLDYNPYLMIYNKPSAPETLIKMQRWVNNKIIWRSCNNFEHYVHGNFDKAGE